MADLTNTYMGLSSFDFTGGFNILGKPEALDSRVTVSNIAYIYEPTHWSFIDKNGKERTILPYTGLIVGDHSGKAMICVNADQDTVTENGVSKPRYCLKSSWKEIGPLENYSYISDFNDGWGEISVTQTSTGVPEIYPSKLDNDINTETGLSLKGAFKLFSAVPGADIELKSGNLDLNKITKAGTYHIHGDLMYCSNYPFTQWTNSSGGSTIDATLLVLDSSVPNNSADPNSKVVTQVLTVSKRIGDDGNIYVRTGVSVAEDSYFDFNWDKWGKLQPNTEIGIVSNNKEYMPNGSGSFIEISNSKGLDSYTDNGIYSGVYLPDGSSTNPVYIETFVVITINNSSITGNYAGVSQFKYALLANGDVTYKYRTAQYDSGNKTFTFNTPWKEISPLENYTDISDFNTGWGEVLVTQTSTNAPTITPSKLNDAINTQTGLSLSGAFKLFSAVPGADIELKSNNLIDLNTITKAGTYHIHGDLMYCSNYPFTQWTNSSGGSTIDATLLVLDPSIASNPTDPNSKVVTQVLTVSKRIGDDGNIYVRTGVSVTEDSYSDFTWDKWGKLQPNTEIGIVSNSNEYMPNGSGSFAEISNLGLDSYTDNGIYSGVYLPDGLATSEVSIETFVVITINNSSITGNSAMVSQFKYALLANGNVTYKYRTAQYDSGNKTFSFNTSWQDLGYPLSDNYTLDDSKTGLSLTGANKLYTELRYRIDTEQEGVSQIINDLIARIEDLESQLGSGSGTGSDSLASRVTALENRLSWNV